MKLGPVRRTIAEVLWDEVKSYELPDFCERLGLPGGTTDESGRSKKQYVLARLNPLGQDALVTVAQKVLQHFDAPELEELIVPSGPSFEIPAATRRRVQDRLRTELGYYLDGEELRRRSRVIAPSSCTYGGAYRFEDPDYAQLKGPVFSRLLEALCHPLVANENAQPKLVALLNEELRPHDTVLRPSSALSGRPVYELRDLHGSAKHRIAQLIFANRGNRKEDLRLTSAIHNTVEAVDDRGDVLIYREPIPATGLSWYELASWWDVDSDLAMARKKLGTRLTESLDSSQENLFFRTYFEVFLPRLKERLPALIPQVLFHHDPKSRARRKRSGEPALARERMDFLLLLSDSHRVVLEVDGKHHYAVGDRACNQRYAKMVREDRKLKLLGYEVYRFGGYELYSRGKTSIEDFFLELFARHGVV